MLAVRALVPTAAWAFAAEGHRIVGAIAEAHLCPSAHAWLAPLLDGTDLGSAGVWADAVRDDPAWAHTTPWHYVNVGDREPLAAALQRGPDNVLAAIERFERELADVRRPLAERQTALRFFVHFVADVHQPLHVGRTGDRGGNDVAVRLGAEEASLHEVWDGRALLAREGLGTRDLAAAIGALARGEARSWQETLPRDWAEESRAWRPVVYDLPQGRSPIRLTPRYVVTARNVLSLRLAQAGVRLAGRLNRQACPGDAPANR
jgi:hypothetical protein